MPAFCTCTASSKNRPFYSLHSDAPRTSYRPIQVIQSFIHWQDASGRVTESRWSVAGLDPVPITAVLPSTASYRNGQPGEWQGLFPLSSLLHGVSIPAEGPDSSFSKGRRPPVSMEVVGSRCRICDQPMIANL